MKTLHAGIALAALAWASAPAEAITGSCAPLARMSYAVSTRYVVSESVQWVAIPEDSVSFIQHGAVPACVIVRYSSSVLASDKRAVIIRAAIDAGSLVYALAEPPFVHLSADHDDGEGGEVRSHSFEFVFPNVKPGPHKVTIQWKMNAAGGVMTTHRHTTIVHHR
jgi:hypothetical protein